MENNQEVIQLNKGVEKKLTQSENSRGYLFVTSDRKILQKLGTDFQVFANGHFIKKASIDNSGRITIGKHFAQSEIKGREVTKQIVIRGNEKELHLNY